MSEEQYHRDYCSYWNHPGNIHFNEQGNKCAAGQQQTINIPMDVQREANGNGQQQAYEGTQHAGYDFKDSEARNRPK